MSIFICTTGTSIAKQDNINKLQNEPSNKQKEFEYEIKATKTAILRKMEDIDIFRNYNETSAEIKSLIKMRINKNDRVILLSSDTVAGKLCADIVKEILESQINCSVEIEVIKGIQSTDGKLFTRIGLKELFNFLLKFKEDEDIIFNPTGGYKSVVPYMAIAGMVLKKPVQYIHEDSEDVITLTGIPLNYDDDLIFKVEDKLKKIEEEGAIPKQEWNMGIDYNDRSYDCLIEEDDHYITLSGIGELFFGKFKHDYPEKLERDNTPAEKKPDKLNSIGISHHGFNRIKPIAEKLKKSPYIKSIINGCDNCPKEKKAVRQLSHLETKQHIQREEVGICIVTDIKSDAGFSFLIKTTARNDEENVKIAELLNKKFI